MYVFAFAHYVSTLPFRIRGTLVQGVVSTKCEPIDHPKVMRIYSIATATKWVGVVMIKHNPPCKHPMSLILDHMAQFINHSQ